jgi:hypothetical protein
MGQTLRGFLGDFRTKNETSSSLIKTKRVLKDYIISSDKSNNTKKKKLEKTLVFFFLYTLIK